jgi:hypothetical protein
MRCTQARRGDYIAKGREQLQENGLGLGLGVRAEGPHSMAGEAVERVLVEYGPAGAPGRERLLVAKRRLWFWGGSRRGELGERLVPLPFHFCAGGLAYTHRQVSYHNSKLLRLLTSDGVSIGSERFYGGRSAGIPCMQEFAKPSRRNRGLPHFGRPQPTMIQPSLIFARQDWTKS